MAGRCEQSSGMWWSRANAGAYLDAWRETITESKQSWTIRPQRKGLAAAIAEENASNSSDCASCLAVCISLLVAELCLYLQQHVIWERSSGRCFTAGLFRCRSQKKPHSGMVEQASSNDYPLSPERSTNTLSSQPHDQDSGFWRALLLSA